MKPFKPHINGISFPVIFPQFPWFYILFRIILIGPGEIETKNVLGHQELQREPEGNWHGEACNSLKLPLQNPSNKRGLEWCGCKRNRILAWRWKFSSVPAHKCVWVCILAVAEAVEVWSSWTWIWGLNYFSTFPIQHKIFFFEMPIHQEYMRIKIKLQIYMKPSISFPIHVRFINSIDAIFAHQPLEHWVGPYGQFKSSNWTTQSKCESVINMIMPWKQWDNSLRQQIYFKKKWWQYMSQINCK